MISRQGATAAQKFDVNQAGGDHCGITPSPVDAIAHLRST
jgi:hypothetical protein